MAGRQYMHDMKLSKAYVEGQTAKIASALQNTNPHVDGCEAHAAWDAGWTAGTSGTDFAGGAMCSAGGYSEPTPLPVLALDVVELALVGTGDDTLTATLTHEGVALEGLTLAAVSSDEEVATVAPASDATDSSGEVVFTVTGVAEGEAVVTVTSATYGLTATCEVTVTAEA